MTEDLVKCPQCNSTQIHASKQGFGIGKAIIGTVTGGILLGALLGSVNKNKIYLTCLKCNNRFHPNELKKETKMPMPANTQEFLIVSSLSILLLAFVAGFIYLIYYFIF